LVEQAEVEFDFQQAQCWQVVDRSQCGTIQRVLDSRQPLIDIVIRPARFRSPAGQDYGKQKIIKMF
jgi:hypothetical protein